MIHVFSADLFKIVIGFLQRLQKLGAKHISNMVWSETNIINALYLKGKLFFPI